MTNYTTINDLSGINDFGQLLGIYDDTGFYTTLDDLEITQTAPVDQTPPTLTSFVQSDPSLTNASTVQYTLVFSEPVTGVDASDFYAYYQRYRRREHCER